MYRFQTNNFKYLANILFEESGDLDLYAWLLDLKEQGRQVSYRDAMNAVKYFALSPKKWQLDGRLKIFTDEMSGYSRLAKKFGYAVAKGKDIIEPTAFDTLKKELVEGYQTADNVRAQTGVKGLFKSQFVRGHDSLKVTMERRTLLTIEATQHLTQREVIKYRVTDATESSEGTSKRAAPDRSKT